MITWVVDICKRREPIWAFAAGVVGRALMGRRLIVAYLSVQIIVYVVAVCRLIGSCEESGV
jgi:hypothetical protein